VEELLEERGVRVDHTTVLHWVQRDAPDMDKMSSNSIDYTGLATSA
jgi:transposase-like protein